MAKEYKQKLKEIIDPIQFTGFPSSWPGISAYGLSDGNRICSRCGHALSLHGVVNRDVGWGTICPGTWRVTHSDRKADGTIEEMTDAKFQAEYEAVKET